MSAERRDLVIGASGMGQLLDAAVARRVEIVVEKPEARARSSRMMRAVLKELKG